MNTKSRASDYLKELKIQSTKQRKLIRSAFKSKKAQLDKISFNKLNKAQDCVDFVISNFERHEDRGLQVVKDLNLINLILNKHMITYEKQNNSYLSELIRYITETFSKEADLKTEKQCIQYFTDRILALNKEVNAIDNLKKDAVYEKVEKRFKNDPDLLTEVKKAPKEDKLFTLLKQKKSQPPILPTSQQKKYK